jgi:hypothetical protein
MGHWKPSASGRPTNSCGGWLYDAILALGPVTTRVNRFGDTAYFYGRKELGHYHADGPCDIYVGRQARDQAIADGGATPHLFEPYSGWVNSPPGDDEVTLRLFRLALGQHR